MLKRLSAFILTVLLFGSLSNALWAQTAKTSRPFSHITEDWARSLDRLELELSLPDQPRRASPERHAVTKRIRTEALEEKEKAEAEMESVDRLLEALGSQPAEGETAEPEALQKKRAELVERRDFYRARIAESELALARASALDQAIAVSAREREFTDLLYNYPLPFLPQTVRVALPEFLQILDTLAWSPLAWWRTISPEKRAAVAPRVAFFLALALAIGWILRRLLLRYFGRDPKIIQPSYARRLIGAVAEGVASGIVPALLFAGMMLRASSDKALISGLFAEVLIAFCAAMIFFIPAWVLPRAVLAPRRPAWRLAPISAQNSRSITRRITALAAIFGLEMFFRLSSGSLEMSGQLVSFLVLVMAALLSLGVVDLTRGSLWIAETPPAPADGEKVEELAASPGVFWPAVRYLSRAIAVGSVLISLAGYAALSNFLYVNLLNSGVTIGILFLLRGLLRELIGVLIRSRSLRHRLAVRHATRIHFKFWLRAVLDISIYVIGALVLVSIWGTPFDDLWASTRDVLRGFTIGNVTISVVDIIVALVVFALALVMTRMLQRVMTDKVLPHTNLDSGVQHSLSAGVGYLGLTVAAVLGVVTLGIDLSSVALIAGALSVGIGFGLQNIVSNFVSGLILLVERPIKIGDWVVVGTNEGFVKRINVRATELETFQRASVIIPNAELLSSAVVNWTHKDRYGRIEVAVGVAYGSDTERVREILLEAARGHAKVVAWPEPVVVFLNFGASSLDFELRCHTGDVFYKIIIASDLRYEIDRRFRAADIEIPFPQRVVHIAAGAAPPQSQPPDDS